MDAFVAELRKIPPVTRFLCASSLSMTIPVILNLVSPYKLVFIPQFVLKKFEVSWCSLLKCGKRKSGIDSMGICRYGESLRVSSSAVSISHSCDNSLPGLTYAGGGINYIFEIVML